MLTSAETLLTFFFYFSLSFHIKFLNGCFYVTDKLYFFLFIFFYIKLFLFFVDEPEEKFIQPKFKPVGPIKSAQSKGRPIWD